MFINFTLSLKKQEISRNDRARYSSRMWPGWPMLHSVTTSA